MPESIDESEVHRIVQKVVSQMRGDSKGPQSSARKRVAIGADHGGFEPKEMIKPDLNALGYEVEDLGTHSKEAVDSPDFAHAVAQAVASGMAWRGIMIDGAGIGSCMVANKVPGVRAGLAYDVSSAMN